MANRFDNFTDRARKALQLAQEEAQHLDQTYIGTPHIVLGLLREEGGLAGQVLIEMGVELDRARLAVVKVLEEHHAIVRGVIGLTPGAKRSIESAMNVAQRLNQRFIGTEHLLLGMLELPDAEAVSVVQELGLASEDVQAAVLKKLGKEGERIEPPGWLSKFREKVQPEVGAAQLEYVVGTGAEPRGSRASDPGRFEKFTQRARKTLQLAQEEAQRFNHNYIGTEHILLGLVREGDGVAARVLNNLGIELNKVRSAVETIIGRGDRMVMGEIGLTPRAKRVIEFAVDEARRLNHHYIGTEHLLLGLVREGEGIAAGVLESLGVTLERVRAEVIGVLKSSSGQQTAGATSSATETKVAEATGRAISGQETSIAMLRTLFDYSIWARDQLLPLIEGLGEEERKKGDGKGVYGSIHDTLAHMAQSEWLWIERCKGESPLRLPKGEDFPTLTSLIDWWNQIHAEAMLLINGIAEDFLDREITYLAPDGVRRTRKVWHMLLQVPNHQTEHRSQVASMLGAMGLEVPPTDLVVYLSRK
jgi:uncharacterized damage-inducible protein DinB